MNTIFSAVDNDGDTIRISDDGSDGMGITVKQDDTPCAMFLDECQTDMLIEALAAFRGRFVQDGDEGYELRLRALRDGKPLLQGIFGPASAEKLVLVAEYLVNGMPEVKA